MTREDIDNIISIICPNDEDFEKPIISPAYLKKELETLALEQEPSGDTISRQAVIDACEQSINILEAVDRIMDLPSVEQEPKTGHWIFDEILDKHYYCSECKSMGVDYWDYCPNCGAKMGEGSEE